MDFLNIAGKTYLISGVANKKSVAYFSAKTLLENGARCIFSAQSQTHLEAIQKLFPDSKAFIFDVERDKNLGQMIGEKIDGFLHSLAFANFSEGPKPFLETRREDYLQAAQISCFSLVEMSNQLKDYLNNDASIVTVSISNTKATSYGYLGPIKAMLDATVPFLAKSFSEFSKIRVNAVGAGPLKTSASAGIPNYIENYLYAEELTLRKSSLQTQEVANTVSFLLSSRSSGINASTLIVDAGMSANYFDQNIVTTFSNNKL